MNDMVGKHCYNRGCSNIFLKYVQNSIDNCPLNKYTYDSLKHILKIGFKARYSGGIN